MAEQLALPLTIPMTKPVVLKSLTAMPRSLPTMDPIGQLNALSRAIGLNAFGGFYHQFLEPLGYRLTEVAAACTLQPDMGHVQWTHPYRPTEIREFIRNHFNLPVFPLGTADQWVDHLTGTPMVKLMDKSDRKLIDFSGHHSRLVFEAEEAVRKSRQLPEETKVRMRKLLAMRRFMHRYGFFARDFLDELYVVRGWTWTEEDDQIWLRAQKPPKQSKVKKLKAAKRKSENDELLKGAR